MAPRLVLSLFSRFVSLAGDVDRKVGDDLVNIRSADKTSSKVAAFAPSITCVFLL
jgi:hypothetical protein